MNERGELLLTAYLTFFFTRVSKSFSFHLVAKSVLEDKKKFENKGNFTVITTCRVHIYIQEEERKEKLQEKNERDNFSYIPGWSGNWFERNSHKIIICAPSFRTISLPSKYGTFLVFPGQPLRRAAAALFKIPSRAAASHDSLTIRVICNSFLVVLAPTSAVRSVFLLRRWWPPATPHGSRTEPPPLRSRLVFPLVITLLFPLFPDHNEEGEREREGRRGRNLRLSVEEGCCWGMVARIFSNSRHFEGKRV